MEKISVNFTHGNAVARITLNDGKGNVLDQVMMAEIQEQLDLFAQKNELKLIVFEGAGKHFSFGASVAEHQKEQAAVMLRSFHRLFFSLSELAIPTLAKISGQCLGGGLELALMCNQLFADKTAKLGQPEIILGVFPPPASVLLPEKIGLARAEDLLLTGRTIDAETSLAYGLLNRVFEDKAALDSGAEAWIEQHILPKSAAALRFAVRAMRIKFNHMLHKFLPMLESMYVNQLMLTADANEGIAAFLEKRSPEWHDN